MVSPNFSDTGIMGHDSRRQMRNNSNEDPLSSSLHLSGDSQNNDSGRKVAVADLVDGYNENPATLERTVRRDMCDMGDSNSRILQRKDELKFNPTGGLLVADSAKDQAGGLPSRYVGSWDSHLGQMRWQDVGDGLHEVQLDWDPNATSYFPKVTSRNSPMKNTCTSHPPHRVYSQLGRADNSVPPTENPHEVSRKLHHGATTNRYRRRYPPTWNKRDRSGSEPVQ